MKIKPQTEQASWMRQCSSHAASFLGMSDSHPAPLQVRQRNISRPPTLTTPRIGGAGTVEAWVLLCRAGTAFFSGSFAGTLGGGVGAGRDLRSSGTGFADGGGGATCRGAGGAAACGF